MTRATPGTPYTYPHGVPSWIDLATPDPDAAREFYGGLLGWSFATLTPPGVPPYVVASLDGADAAALAAQDVAVASWRTYVAVDDAEVALTRAADLGARVVEPVTEVGAAGRSAVVADPEGNELRLWQARERLGAQVANTPGAWNFSNLRTADPAAAQVFYGELFGWRYGDMGIATSVMVEGYGRHLASTVYPDILEVQAFAPDGFEDVVGGFVPAGADSGPPGWYVVFTVADRDASAAEAARLGGSVLARFETEWTAEAVVRDPGGATLTLSQFTPPEGA